MKKNARLLVTAFVTTFLLVNSFTYAQSNLLPQGLGFWGDVSVKIYCTFAGFIPGSDNSACKTDVVVTTPTGNISATSTNTNSFSQVREVINRTVNPVVSNVQSRLVYVPGPAGRDGKNGTTTVVFQSIPGAVNPSPTAYIYAGGNGTSYNSNYNPYQTTVPGDIHSTFIHHLRWEDAYGDIANITNINATNTFTVNLTANNFTLGTGTIATTSIGTANVENLWANNATTVNSTSTNLFAMWGYIMELLADNATITNATTTNFFSDNASVTNATTTNLFSVFANIWELVANNATITNATTTNLFSDNASITNATATNIFANFASITAATTTDLFSTRASITEATTTYFFAAWATFLNMFVENLSFVNATGTNLQVANASTTNLSATGTTFLSNALIASTTINYGEIQSGNATVTALVAQNSTSTNHFATNASITNATTTNLFSTWLIALNAMFTNLTATNATITNATTTNLSANRITGDGSNNLVIGTNSNNDISFISNGVEVFRIQDTGNELTVTGTNDMYVGDDFTARDIFASTSLVTSATNTNLFSTNASITNATTTNLFANMLNVMNAVIDTLAVNIINSNILNVGVINATSSVNTLVLNASSTNASTSWVSTLYATSSIIDALGSLNITTGNIFATNTATLANADIVNATLTNATVTNLYSIGGNISLGTTTMYGSLIPYASTTGMTLGTISNPWSELFVSSSSVYIGGYKISNVDGTLTWNGNSIVTTNGTSSEISLATVNASTTNASTTNTQDLVFVNATGTNATSTNLFATFFGAVNAKIDSLLVSNATITNGTSTNLFASWFNTTNATIDNLIVTNTIVNATITNATTTNLRTTFLNGINATITNATTTNLAAIEANIVKVNVGVLNGTGSTKLGILPTTLVSNIANAGIVPIVSVIDQYTGQNIETQGLASYFIPAPTNTADIGKIFLLNNVGTNTIKITGAQMLGGDEFVLAKQSRQLVWTGFGWSPTVGNLAKGGTNSYSIRKGSNQTTTLNTLQNDSALNFSIAAGEKWFVQVNYEITQTGGAQSQVGFANSSTGGTCNYATTVIEETTSTSTCGAALITNTPANTALLGALTADTGVASGIFTGGSTGGTVTFQFSRQGAGGTNVINQADSHLIAFRIDGADLAEVYFAKDSSVEEGDVVALDGGGVSQIAKSNKKYQKNVLGIISTKPGLVMGEVDGDGKAVVVGLSGRVPVKVTDKNGKIKAGDFLTASDIPGVAMKATGAGQVIGQALTDDTGTGKVMVFIKNTYHDGNSDDDTEETLADKFAVLVKNAIEKLSDTYLNMTLAISSLRAENVSASKVSMNEFCVGSECFTEADMKEFRNYLNSKKAPVETPVTTESTPVEIPVENTSTENTETPVTETPVTETPVTETPVTETPVESSPTTGETPVEPVATSTEATQ